MSDTDTVSKDAEELLEEKEREIDELRDTFKQMISNWRDRAEKAEDELAAERAEHDNTISTLTSLITDNAAKDARVKELEAEFDQAVGVIEDRASENQALEAKLAAAEEELNKIYKEYPDIVV